MNKRDEIWKVKFIEELRKRGAVEEACIAAGISVTTVYAARKRAMISREANGAPTDDGSTSLTTRGSTSLTARGSTSVTARDSADGFAPVTICDFAAQWEDAIRGAIEREVQSARDANAKGSAQKLRALPKKRRPRVSKGSWHNKFIEELRQRGVVIDAARAAHIDVSTVYNERRKALRLRSAKVEHETQSELVESLDPSRNDFAARWDEAIDDAVHTLEAEAWRRARDGYSEPVYYRGRQVGEVVRYSDGLLSLLLKANRPKKYREPYRLPEETLPDLVAMAKSEFKFMREKAVAMLEGIRSGKIYLNEEDKAELHRQIVALREEEEAEGRKAEG